MRIQFFILFLFGFSLSFCSLAQNNEHYTQSRILFLVDESSSMLQTWYGEGTAPKYKIANEIVVRLMDSVYAINKNVEFSLRVFGNQSTVPEHDCKDTKNEVPFSPDNRAQMEFRLDAMHPLGVTAIAYSLSQAAENDLTDVDHNAYSIILITDGGESCGGDICGVMQKLIKNKVIFKPYILSLEDEPSLKGEYDCLGDYLAVTTKKDITKAVTTIVETFRPVLKLSKEQYQKLQIIAANTPSILKVNIPAIKTADTLAIKPKPVVKTKPADTVAVVPKTSNIVVGELKDRPAPTPVKIKKLQLTGLVRLYTAPAKKTVPKTIEVTPHEYKPAPEDVVVTIPAPVKIKELMSSSLTRFKTTKPVLPIAERVAVTVPEVKQPEPTVMLAKIAPLPLKRIKVTKPALAVAEKIAVTIPEIKQPVPAPTPTVIANILPSPLKRKKITKGKLAVAEVIAVNVPEYKPAEIEPVHPAAIKIAAIKPSALQQLSTVTPKLPKAKLLVVPLPEYKPAKPEVAKVDTVVPPPAPVVAKRPKEVWPRLKFSNIKVRILYIFNGASEIDSIRKLVKVIPPPAYVPKPEEVKPKPKPVVTPPPTKPVAKTGEYKVEHEDAKETTLEVYLTNGKGKFFSTTPRVVLKDPATGKEIRKFNRYCDAAGNPDPITDLPAGKYDLEIVGRDDLLAHVDMQPNKRNKVLIKVKDYSLYFYYNDAPDRPVKEFVAEVIQRNVASGKITNQKCTEKLEFEPGNYHITINTFPQDIRNIDLDMESAGGIGIAQPGFAKFVAEVNTKSVGLYKQLGDRFVQFYTLNLNDPASQHLQIQPGRYQAHYNNGETKFNISERVITFEVKSTKETIVTLGK